MKSKTSFPIGADPLAINLHLPPSPAAVLLKMRLIEIKLKK
jgi:hypothetical protein